jgi:hypothetical protein
MITSLGLTLACEGLLLGMRAEGHRDFKTEAHPRMHILTNLRSEMKVATHLRLFCARSSRPCEAQAEAGAHFGGHFCTGGLKAVKGSRRWSPRTEWPQGDEEAMPEVYSIDDVAGWTRVASSFVGHRNICISQRTVMTP